MDSICVRLSIRSSRMPYGVIGWERVTTKTMVHSAIHLKSSNSLQLFSLCYSSLQCLLYILLILPCTL